MKFNIQLFGGRGATSNNSFYSSKIKEKVYHGTAIDFEEFDEKYIKERPDGIKGFYFAPEKRKDSVAGYYAGDTGVIKEAYLDIKKPLYLKSNEDEKLKKLIKSGKIKNYDAIVKISHQDMPESRYFNYRTKSVGTEQIKKGDIIEIIAFNKKQIKVVKGR